jgi:hypothetical protein
MGIVHPFLLCSSCEIRTIKFSLKTGVIAFSVRFTILIAVDWSTSKYFPRFFPSGKSAAEKFFFHRLYLIQQIIFSVKARWLS